jgi:hypothetical protein
MYVPLKREINKQAQARRFKIEILIMAALVIPLLSFILMVMGVSSAVSATYSATVFSILLLFTVVIGSIMSLVIFMLRMDNSHAEALTWYINAECLKITNLTFMDLYILSICLSAYGALFQEVGQKQGGALIVTYMLSSLLFRSLFLVKSLRNKVR